MNTRSALISIVLVTLVTAGCGPAGSVDEGTSTPAPQRISHPTGASDVVLRVRTGGGFVPLEVSMRELPEFTLYGDGTVIVPGAVAAIYPGPAIPPLNTFRLSEEQVQQVLLRARRAGLLEAAQIDYGDMGSVGVSDMPTTSAVINADGRRVRHDAYALGAAGGRLTPAQRQARTALSEFLAALPHDPSAQEYAPSALMVNVAPFTGERQPGSTPMVWPLGGDLATEGTALSDGLPYRCVAVTGADAEVLLSSLRTANEQTEWLAREGGNRAFRLVVRPMLPDEQACPAM